MFSGRCECGQIEYRVDGEINDFSHCHCSQCRRLHGAAFGSYAGVERDDFQYLKGESALASYASSATHQRLFCSNCGSNIMVTLTAEPDAFYVAMGTIDGNPSLPPGYHIFVGSKAPWFEITDSLPQYETAPEDL